MIRLAKQLILLVLQRRIFKQFRQYPEGYNLQIIVVLMNYKFRLKLLCFSRQ